MSVNTSKLSLYKRANQIYYIGYYTNGRRRWKSTGVRTKHEALQALTRFQDFQPDRSDRPSLARFLSDFLKYAENTYSAKTCELYRRAFDTLQSLVGDILLDDLCVIHFDRYKCHRLKVVKSTSCNMELRAIRTAMHTAQRWHLIEKNPFLDVTFAPVPEQSPVFFSAQEFQRLVDSIAEDWFRDVILCAALTGMRRGEILNLLWSQVDLVRRVVHVQTTPTFKTKAGRRRTIPLSDSAVYLLQSRKGKSSSEFVFTLNDRQILSDWVTHLFKRYVRKAGLDDRLHFHSVRHSFASWLVQSGSTLYEVQRLLGHSSS